MSSLKEIKETDSSFLIELEERRMKYEDSRVREERKYAEGRLREGKEYEDKRRR